MPLEPGTILGRYSIVSSLGAGGMGEVYRATDSSLGREVAIKVLPEAVTTEVDRLTRFEREAKALAALNHPNIATLFGMERASLDGQEQPFLVMELVEGPTLGDRIARGAMPWQEAAKVFLEIAAGLEAAHESGIVHRDLKPANVKIGQADASGEARVRVLDFGLAKAMDVEALSGSRPGGLSESPTLTLAATMRGEVLGTAGYMAPEQARGTAIDKRADVWAFGVCLFEALSGQGTFAGDTVTDKLASVLKDEPDWKALPADLPPRLVELLERCLEKSVRVRLRDIGEARIVLSALLADPAAAMRPLGSGQKGLGGGPDDGGTIGNTLGRRFGTIGLAAAVLAAFAIGAGLVWLSGSGPGGGSAIDPGPRPAVRFTIGGADDGPLGEVGGITVSPDGRWLVYGGITSEVAGRVISEQDPPLRVRALNDFDSATRTLEGTEGAITPFFSPDSEWVGYLTGSGGQRRINKVHVETGSIVEITTDDHVGYRADWAEDGTIVLGAARGPMLQIALGKSMPERVLVPLDSASAEVAHTNPETLPGGRGILFTSLLATESAPAIKVWDARNDDVRTIIPRGGEARYLKSGHLLYAHDGDLLLVAFDLEHLTIAGDPRVVVKGVRMRAAGDASFDVTGDGTLVYLPGSVQETTQLSLLWMTPEGQEEELTAQGDLYFPTVSRDGRRWLARTGPTQLTLFEQGAPVPIHFKTDYPIHYPPFFMPDGQEVIFGVVNGTEPGLVRLDLGTGKSTYVRSAGDVKRIPIGFDEIRGEAITATFFSEDGGASLQYGIGAGDLEGQEPTRLLVDSPAAERHAKLSKAGDLLAWEGFTNRTLYGGTLYVADYPDMARRIPIGESISTMGYAWGPQGQLYFADIDSQSIKVATFVREPELRVASVETVFAGLYTLWTQRSFDVAPDGRLLIIRGATVVDEGKESGRFMVVVGWTDELGLGR